MVIGNIKKIVLNSYIKKDPRTGSYLPEMTLVLLKEFEIVHYVYLPEFTHGFNFKSPALFPIVFPNVNPASIDLR